MNAFIEIFRNKGLKATPQRIAIYQSLLESHEHPTAEKIFEHIKHFVPGLSLGTVYKTLDMLVEFDLARKVLTEDNFRRYDAKTEAHHHIIMEDSKEIIDFEDPMLDEMVVKYLKQKNIPNLDISHVKIQILGKKKESQVEIKYKK